MRTLKISLLVFILSITISSQWYQQNSNTLQPIHDIEFIDSISGMAVGGDGTVFRTSDGGKNWATENIGYSNWLYSIELVDDSIGYLTGMGGLIYKTTNFGVSWIQLFTNVGGNFFSTIHFINANVGWTAGDYGIILKTTDGGINWIQQPINTQNFIEDIEFIDELHGWAISKWHVFRSINGGNEWTEITNPTNYYKYSICFIDSVTGWLTGGGERIYKTEDGGDTWILQHTGDQHFNDIYFISALKGWAIGRHYYVGGWQGEIVYTSDGGNTWVNQESGVTEELYSIHLINESIGWIVGDSGLILVTDNGGIVSVYSELNNNLIENFALKQNYPNPFNPSTSLQYAIGSRQFVTLKVYDLLGREIATRVNEDKPAGEYEVEFDGTALPSGIYFYQLKAGEFVETRKMVLLK